MRNAANWCGVAAATLLLGLTSATTVAQPRKERHERRQERRDEVRHKLQEKAAEFREKYGEELAALKLKGAELRAAWREQVDYYKDLRDRAQKGELTPEEQAELDELQKKADEAKKKLESLTPADVKEAVKKAIVENRQKLLAAWGQWILANSNAQAELDKHAHRVAELERAKAVAEAQGRADFAAHIDEVMKVENQRHDAAMKLLKTKEAP